MKKFGLLSLVVALVVVGSFAGYQLVHAVAGEGTANIEVDGAGTSQNANAQRGASHIFIVRLTVGGSGITVDAPSPTFEIPAGFTAPSSTGGGATPPTNAGEVDVDGEWFATASGGGCIVTMGTSSAAAQVITVDVTGICVTTNTITLYYQGRSNVTMAATPLVVSTADDATPPVPVAIASSPTITVFDSITPTVSSIVRASASPTTASSLDFTVTFSEDVTGVDTLDFAVAATGTATGTVASVSGSGSVYTVTVNAIAGDGGLRLDLIDNGSIDDVAAIGLGGGNFTTGEEYSIDNTASGAPVIASVAGDTSTPGASSDSTPDVAISGITIGDTVTVYDTNGTTVLGTVLADAITETITLSALSEAAHTLTAKAIDPLGNTSTASNAFVYTYDNTVPTAPVIDSVAGDTATPGTSNDSTPDVALSGITSGDTVTVYDTDGTTVVGTFVASATTGTVTLSALSEAAHTLTAKAIDPAGNTSTASNAFVYTLDATAPSTPVITPSAGSYTVAQTIAITSAGSDTIRYTTDGTTPTCAVGTLYASAFSLSTSITVKAVGCDTALNASSVATNAYTITISSGGGGGAPAVTAAPVSVDAALSLTLNRVERLGDGTTRIWINLNANPNTVRGYALSTDPSFTFAALFDYESLASITVPSSPSSVTIYGRYYSTTGDASATLSLSVDLTSGVVVVPPIVPQPLPQANPPVETVLNPSVLLDLLPSLGLVRDIPTEGVALLQAKADAREFGLTLTAAQAEAVRNFIVYGNSPTTIKFGSGERRAIVRDYMDTIHRSDIVWSDIERMANGLIPLVRNVEKEASRASVVLSIFRTLFGHAPNQQNATENLAHDTLMHRIRFPRNLVKEGRGLAAYYAIFKHSPTTPFGWSVVRVLGYVR